MKIYVIAGNTQQFLHYRADKYNTLKDTVDGININDFVNVSSHNVLRGVANPHGVFIGTWRERLDIIEILNTLSLFSHAANPVLDKLRSEMVPSIKPTPKVVNTNPPPYDTGIDAAAAALAKEIDDHVLRTMVGKPATMANLDTFKQLIGASKAVYDSETSTMSFDRWFNSWSDSIK